MTVKSAATVTLPNPPVIKMLEILQREVSPNKTHTCHLLDTTVHGIQVCTHSCGHSPPGVSIADKSL